jgi:hypothetical protein
VAAVGGASQDLPGLGVGVCRPPAAHRQELPQEGEILSHGEGSVHPTIKNKDEAFSASRSGGTPYSTAVKWLRPAERRKIYQASAQAYAGRLLRIDKNSRRKGRYSLMEKDLYGRLSDRRKRARKVSARWIVHTARHLMRVHHPDKAEGFKAGPGWLRRFAKRWRLCRRKKTNCKNTTWEDTKPVLQRYFRTFRRRLKAEGWQCAESGDSSSAGLDCWWKKAEDVQKWGQYLPHLRLNVDQVPLPFICDMDYTYETKGAKRVAINQLGPSLSKRQCTAQVCFRPVAPPQPPSDAPGDVINAYRKYLAEQPNPCIVFQRMGRGISQAELDAYPPDLVALWQPKAWVDRPIARAWVDKVIKPLVEANRMSGVTDETSRYLLIQDNLDAQCQPEYLDALKALHVDDHKVPPNKTNQVQPIDRGFERLVKVYVGQELDKWLDDVRCRRLRRGSTSSTQVSCWRPTAQTTT